ncbi:MAG: hypothetical protein H0U72_06635 [Nitrosospira sp.]|nr:hypothetical protein [Nitrosospira sp.]
MKSQDILLLLKLVSLSQKEKTNLSPKEKGVPIFLKSKWKDWEDPEVPSDGIDFAIEEVPVYLRATKTFQDTLAAQYSVRNLGDAIGISKSEVSLALQRCYVAGLAKPDRLTGTPRVNQWALREFIIHGLRYVYPAKLSGITRGIATAWAAPVLQERVMSAGEIVPVWPDARGKTMGQAIAPLFKSVPTAVRKDAYLYSLLALTDAIRIGQPRERNIAMERLDLMLQEAG